MPILFVLSYVLPICHMAQFIFEWPILFFRGDSLSRCQLNVHFVLDFIFQSYGFIFSKLVFPHKFSFAPPGYVLTKCGNVPRICCGNLHSCFNFRGDCLSWRSIVESACNWKWTFLKLKNLKENANFRCFN